MIAVEELASGYGRIGVLGGVSFRVERGECVGILGHNGMGKSTLLKTIIGLLAATAGRISFAGQRIERLPTHRRARLGIGYVPQGRLVFPALTVAENLRFAALAKRDREGAADRDVLEDFPELERLLDRSAGALSGGEQQLLAIARALSGRPTLLLLDEPTEGIQPSIVAAIGARIAELRHRRGLTVLLVEQNLDFIRRLADRVLLIHRGRIVRELPPAALEEAALVQEFIGAAAPTS
ncbi:MAG: ABC transporter ATP-binding protein [Alphaproteobacteria bacterium]|nr:ABC transporter ATP-binding protein [Alphaproteobacteria bacterium]